LSIIERMGMISRRRRSGTRVEAAHPTAPYSRSITTLQDLIQYAAETERHVRRIEPVTVDERTAGLLGCRPGQRWLHVGMVRVNPQMADRPICWTDVYLDPEVGELIRDELVHASGLICDMMEHASGRFVADVEQTIRATQLSESLSEELHAPAGSAALEITRRYRDTAGAVTQITVSTHPADRFDYRLTLRRS
jgi:DNA-binding GntR family transcriptional regulator